MIENVKLLNIVSAMTRHAAQRHAKIAENISNADTPQFKAKDIESFSTYYKTVQQVGKTSIPLKPEEILMDTRAPASPNGNNVTLEEQMMLSVEVKNRHEMATAIYKKTLDMMKMAIGKNL